VILVLSRSSRLLFTNARAWTSLSALRARVRGQWGFWSEARKGRRPPSDPATPTRTTEHDYHRYLAAIARAARRRRDARLENRETAAHAEIVRRGFAQGRNHPEDVLPMARLFRTFRPRQLHRRGDHDLGPRRPRHREAASPGQSCRRWRAEAGGGAASVDP
jgi:hypothetical protein